MPEHARAADPLADLRERLEATRQAAEKLAGEAAGAASADARGEQPPEGWRTQAERDGTRDDAAAFLDLLATLSRIVPEELRAQLAEVVRQVLLLVRALIDWVVQQLPQAQGQDRVVRDIPVS